MGLTWILVITEFCLIYSQFDEQKDQVLVEQILQVVFLDTERPSLVSRIN